MISNTQRQVMIDLETLSVRPYATILSIGAVAFNIEEGVLDTFYVNVDAQSCKDAGLHVSKSSVDWWSQQSKEAQKALTVNPLPVREALQQFKEWYGEDRTIPVWGNGAAFDISILESAYWSVDIEIPWLPWHVMCYRTILNVLNIKSWELDKEGVAHNALDDAMNQANNLIKVFRK
jgi:DNA polymerase III epsilon subunit-like protein